MIQFILYFLSKFSVKIKVAFLIIFLISGVLFWNMSYLNGTIIQNERTEHILESFDTAQEVNVLLYSLQKERAYSIAVNSHKYNKSILDNIRKNTDMYLEKFKVNSKYIHTHNNEKIVKKIDLLLSEIDDLKVFRSEIDAHKIEADEIVRFYTDTLIKHFIDLIAYMTTSVESNDFNAYFNLISSIEYMSLEYAFVQVAMASEDVFDQELYDLITNQEAKSQTYIDRFKTFAEPDIMRAYYKLYSTSSFIGLTQILESLKSQLGQKVTEVDIKSWILNTEKYMQNIKDIEKLNSNAVKNKIETVLAVNNAKYTKNIWILMIPLAFVLIIAWFIFIDIKHSLNTLLTFLKEKGVDKQKDILLIQSKSELGTVYRTLFAFNEKIKDQIQVIENTYETDQLTNIPNRNKLLKEMRNMKEAGNNFTVIYIDIYNFSHINDSFGQDIGDIYLQETAQVLDQIAGSISSDALLETSVFRMGSDEFVLICSHNEYINLLIAKLKEIYIINHKGIDMPLSFTFGIANSDDKHSQSSILSRAEIASRFAIRNHKRYEYYSEDEHFETKHKANLEWVKKIAKAFNDGLFAVHFQPIADTRTKRVVKYEVLIRMYDKDREIMISPAEFLSILQNAGHEKDLTKLIIEQSFQSYEKCKIDLSINMTRDDLDEDMLDYLISKTTKHGISPKAIVVELVESEELLNDKYLAIIKEIRAAGFKIAIDDFGTGYSNFAYLTQIKPDYIKIDGSLIEGIVESKEELQVVEGIYSFANNLGIEVIAEFVSSDAIYEKIKEIGIEYVQGYHIGYVMSCEEIVKIRDKEKEEK